jgi:hypothetical protein
MKRTRAQFYAGLKKRRKDPPSVIYDLLYMLYQYDELTDNDTQHKDFEVSERIHVAFTDLIHGFNGKGIDADAVLWGMVKAMREHINDHNRKFFQ